MTYMDADQAIWIPGRPATFATAMEKPWKEHLLQVVSAAAPASFDRRDLAFRLPPAMMASEGYDLDNLCDPVFTVLATRLGWFGGRQTNIKAWRARKTAAEPSGLLIKPLPEAVSPEGASMVLFDGKYAGPLPGSAKSPGMPAWLLGMGRMPEIKGPCGMALSFVNIGRSIASLSDGLVKHVVDCLYPLYGGPRGNPFDHRIHELIVERLNSEAQAKHVRVVLWEHRICKPL